MSKRRAIILTFTLLCTETAFAQPPVRKFDDPGSPPFTVLKTGENPPLDVDGNFVIGPEYTPAPERKAVEGVPQGKVKQFTIDSKETKLFNPGIARKVFGKVDPNNPKTLIVETHNIDYKRQITVYIPTQHVAGSEAPFMVCHDGPTGKPNMDLPRILDNLIAQKRIPPIIAILVANGGGDAQGHERGKEYDTMSGMFADYIEAEVLPRVEKNCEVKLTKDPDGRAAMGNSSGGSAALIMAWYRTNLYHRVLTTSGTFVNQQWPFNPETPGGAWDFHETIIPKSPKKPLRIFISVGDRDLLNPNVMRDDMHDWVEANNRMAKVLKAKGYEYQYLFCRNAGHSIGNAQAQFLPHAIEWVWRGYAPKKSVLESGSAAAQEAKPDIKLLVNSPDEPVAKMMSLAKTAEFLDHQSRAWTQVKKCGTCHTNLPYLVARGQLGGDLTALSEVRGFFEKRIAGWESGRKEDLPKRDTEVIATAATLALQDALTTGKLHPLTRKALDRMWTLQQPNGAWDWLKCGWPPLEHDDYYGVVYAALAVGHAPDKYAETEQAKKGLDGFRKYFRNNPAPSLHHKAMLLWASQKVSGIMSAKLKKSTILELRGIQKADGGWSLPMLGDWVGFDERPNDRSAPSDGYATGLVVYVLRQAGVPADDEAIQKGVAWLKNNQRESGRWFTPSINTDRYHFLTHAGTAYAVLALKACE